MRGGRHTPPYDGRVPPPEAVEGIAPRAPAAAAPAPVPARGSAAASASVPARGSAAAPGLDGLAPPRARLCPPGAGAGTNAGVDANADADAGAGTNAGVDANADAGVDADADAGGGDGPGASANRAWLIVIEVAAVVAFLQWHGALRHWAAGGMDAAVRHGLQLIRVERALHVFFEGSIQRTALRHPDVERLSGWYYGSLHLAVPVVAAVIARARTPDWYRTCRRAFVLMAVVALAVFWLWPLAPPRLMPPHFGFIDVLAHDVHLPAADHLFAPSLYNGVAAMPSLHIGFAIWAAAALWPVTRQRPAVRVLLVAHPCLMLLATMATGNHFFLDGVAGAALLAAAFKAEPIAQRLAAHVRPPALPVALVAGAAFIWVPVHAPAIMVEDLALAALAAVALARVSGR